MTAQFEQIVRPFQTQDVTPPKRILDAAQPPAPDTLVTFGKESSGKTFLSKMFLFVDFNLTGDQTHVEVSRTEQTIRVKNPDDPEQHVDVARIRSMNTRGENDPTDRMSFKFSDGVAAGFDPAGFVPNN